LAARAPSIASTAPTAATTSYVLMKVGKFRRREKGVVGVASMSQVLEVAPPRS